MGLPSKTKALNDVAEGMTGSSSANFTPVPETGLTPQEQSFSKAVQAMQQSKNPQEQNIPSPTPQAPEHVAPQGTGHVTPIYKESPYTHIEKANEPVTALPGQKKVGVV